MPITQAKWRLRDLVGRESKYGLERRKREGLHRDIGEVTSFRKVSELVERILKNFERWYPRRSSGVGTGHVGQGSRKDTRQGLRR